jgi:hypothetical protein
VTELGEALQTRYELYSCGQHPSHHQIHNHTTLSNPRDRALKLRRVYVAYFDVHESNIGEEPGLLASDFEVL